MTSLINQKLLSPALETYNFLNSQMKTKSYQSSSILTSSSNSHTNPYLEYKPQRQTQQFFHIKDQRSPQQKLRQSKQAQQIYKNNLKTLGIDLTSKKKVQYTPANLFRVDFPNQWYAMITDNELERQFTVFTLHGSPGDHRQWAGLEKQMNETVRWINFIIPGFDGLDERRGDYSGSAQDLSKLIIMVLNQRKASKVIYCGHSMGSIFGSYFIYSHPSVVKGYINVTGIVNQWYVGLLTFYRTTAYRYGFGRGPYHNQMIKLLNDNEFRQRHHKQFLNDIKGFGFIDKVPFPQLTVSQMCAYIKLFTSLPRGCSQFYQLNQKLTLLRMLIFGRNDPLHQIPKTDEQIYSITRGRFRYDGYSDNQKLIKLMKRQLQAKVKQLHGITIQAQRIQQYFCYHFEDTGHNAHKRRPIQMSIILKVYVTVLSVIEKYKPLIETKL